MGIVVPLLTAPRATFRNRVDEYTYTIEYEVPESVTLFI